MHFNCLVGEADFYSNMVECWHVDPATRVGFLALIGWNFLIFINGDHSK